MFPKKTERIIVITLFVLCVIFFVTSFFVSEDLKGAFRAIALALFMIQAYTNTSISDFIDRHLDTKESYERTIAKREKDRKIGSTGTMKKANIVTFIFVLISQLLFRLDLLDTTGMLIMIIALIVLWIIYYCVYRKSKREYEEKENEKSGL